jgi:hypothetical protein
MAASLTPAERRERLKTDHRMLAALDADSCPIHVSGHRSAADVRTDRDPVPVGNAEPPAHFRVTYDFDTIRGPGQRHRPTVVHVAPLTSPSYPATPPSAWVVSDVVPWTPHFAARVPVCHGSHVWIPYRTQLVDYVIHIGKLLNFDEPPPIPGYHGYNGAAVDYWRETMKLAPLNPGLRFPLIRPEDVVRPDAFSRAVSTTAGPGRFRRAESSVAVMEGARIMRAARQAREGTPRISRRS